MSISDGECLFNDDISSQREDAGKAEADLPAEYNGCRKFDSGGLDSLDVYKESQKADCGNHDA
jgi:hypothetical protein